METPKTNHISRKDYEFIYEPAEDSFLLLDAIEADLDFIKNRKPQICVEIGSGSGIIITAFAKKLNKNIFCIATDINSKACNITQKTALQNSTKLDVIHMDLTRFLRSNCIDVLFFNPPYVVTDPDDSKEFKNFSDPNIVHSWAGGYDGCKVINRVLNNLKNILSENGIFYLLCLKENKPLSIIKKLEKDKFHAEIFMERKIPGEHLFILKIIK